MPTLKANEKLCSTTQRHDSIINLFWLPADGEFLVALLVCMMLSLYEPISDVVECGYLCRLSRQAFLLIPSPVSL